MGKITIDLTKLSEDECWTLANIYVAIKTPQRLNS